MKKQNNSGSTMVSVIVAFVLLMIGIMMFTTVIYAVFDLTAEAERVRRKADTAMEAYYTGNLEEEREVLDGIWLKDQDSKTSFSISGKVYEGSYQGYRIYFFADK